MGVDDLVENVAVKSQDTKVVTRQHWSLMIKREVCHVPNHSVSLMINLTHRSNVNEECLESVMPILWYLSHFYTILNFHLCDHCLCC